MCMCPANALVNVGETEVVYRTESSMKTIYEEMMQAPPRVMARLSKENSLHPVEVSLEATIQ